MDISDDSEDNEVLGAKIAPSSSSKKTIEEEKSGSKQKKTVPDKNSISGGGSISKASQRKKDLDEMNKSVDSLENFMPENKQEGNKMPILVSLKHIKG